MFTRRFPLVLILAAFAVYAGCGRQEDKASSVDAASDRRETRVVIPEEVLGKWKAVRISVLDKEKNKEEIYTVDLGYEFTLAQSGISVKVQNFLPSFIMEGTVLTSVSNQTSNPAVQIIIREQGKELFKGWLFGLYPGAHAFQHPRYAFTLVDYIPAKNS